MQICDTQCSGDAGLLMREKLVYVIINDPYTAEGSNNFKAVMCGMGSFVWDVDYIAIM